MGWVGIVSNISLVCLFIIVSIDFVLTMIATCHPKYSKNKLLYEKLMLPVTISLIFWLVLFLLYGLPIFFTNEVPVNIKIGLIVLYIGSMGFVIWAVRHEYRKYKALAKGSSSNVLGDVEYDIY